jgi:hypothetical protein
MGDPDIDALVRERRQIRAARRVARCERCRDTRHLVTTPTGEILCYACRRLETGGSDVERDHVAGRANLGGLLVDLRANDHRTVTDVRIRLGIDAWPPAAGDPLLVLAHVLAGLASLLILLAEWLRVLAAELTERLGQSWWAGLSPHPVAS